MNTTVTYFPTLEKIREAASKLDGVVQKTPLSKSQRYSKELACSVYFKREDLQRVRSYKIRGAYNKIASLVPQETEKGIVCASAGNHAQGVALSCRLLEIHGVIYMPATTPQQKIEQVRMFGEDFVEVRLMGDTFDDSFELAQEASYQSGKTFVHPFDDEKIIEGQATVGLEILEQCTHPIDYVIVPIGGGGLAAGLGSIFKHLSPTQKLLEWSQKAHRP